MNNSGFGNYGGFGANIAGFTGIDPDEAKKNIKDFYNKAYSAIKELHDSFDYLFSELMELWASPNAETFSTKFSPEINGILKSIEKKAYDICEGAVSAYNTVASSQGIETISLTDPPFNFGDFDYKFSQKNNGLVGMNINTINNYTLVQFQKKNAVAIIEIEKLPTEIALYDDQSKQQHSYKTGIKGWSDLISKKVDSIVVDLKKYCAVEAENTELGANRAADSIESSFKSGENGLDKITVGSGDPNSIRKERHSINEKDNVSASKERHSINEKDNVSARKEVFYVNTKSGGNGGSLDHLGDD